jgi:amidase
VSDDPTTTSITGLQGLIERGDATRRDIVLAHLERIELVNPSTNTFVEVRRNEVLAEAEAADATHGRRLAGPLDGVPLSIKDSYGIRGLRRSDGLVANADRYADRDDTVVTRLRDAGALLLGHGNVPDMCVRWNTVSGLYGTSRNPRDLERSVGGSSGGEAGNVAAGMATAAIGQDLGGSIRVPASFCGVYGIRSTPGSRSTRRSRTLRRCRPWGRSARSRAPSTTSRGSSGRSPCRIRRTRRALRRARHRMPARFRESPCCARRPAR